MTLVLILVACVATAWACVAGAVLASRTWRAWHGEERMGWEDWPVAVEFAVVGGLALLAVLVLVSGGAA